MCLEDRGSPQQGCKRTVDFSFLMNSSTGFLSFATTHRPLSSSSLGLPYRILYINHKKELLRGLGVEATDYVRFPSCMQHVRWCCGKGGTSTWGSAKLP